MEAAAQNAFVLRWEKRFVRFCESCSQIEIQRKVCDLMLAKEREAAGWPVISTCTRRSAQLTQRVVEGLYVLLCLGAIVFVATNKNGDVPHLQASHKIVFQIRGHCG